MFGKRSNGGSERGMKRPAESAMPPGFDDITTTVADAAPAPAASGAKAKPEAKPAPAPAPAPKREEPAVSREVSPG